MIFDLFLPKKVGNYYLFPERIAGIEINKTHVRATVVNAQATHVIIEQYIDVPIEAHRDLTPDQRIINALKIVKEQLPSRCAIHTVLPSSLIIYKELLLPFTSRETIAQVVRFEIEPLLPFRLDQAIVDFIITKTLPEEKSSQIMVAAVQKQHIAHHIALFEQATMHVDAIITDIFALYNVYLQIPAYAQLTENIVLIDMSLYITRIAFIQHGQIRLIRTINNGLSACAKYVGDQLQIPTTQALEQILRFGLQKEHHEPHAYEAIIQGCTQLWQTIQFTLASFSGSQQTSQKINQGLVLGEGARIPGLTNFMSSYFDIPCVPFNAQDITNNPHIKLGKQVHSIVNDAAISLGASLPSPLMEDFSLRAEEFKISETRFYLKELITIGVLITTIFGALLIFNIMRVRSMRNELESEQQEAITALQERFKTIEEDETDLEDAITKARDELKHEEETWFAFSNKTRFLQYLFELTTRIDKKKLGFVPEAISITPTTITLKARVKSIEALKELERELKQSKLFSFVEPQEKTSFTMRINIAQSGV